MQRTDELTEDPFFQSARWLEPPTKRIPGVYQSPETEIGMSMWETFQELPKPLAWSEAESNEEDPPRDSAWERMWRKAGLGSLLRNKEGSPVDKWRNVQARPILDLNALVSRSYLPSFEDGPRPLRVWHKPSIIRDRTSYPVDEKICPPIPDYDYTRLMDSDEIRILDLLPGQGNEPLAFTLRSSHLNDRAVNYEAISYVWGTAMVDLCCGGNRFSFPHNLYRALIGLRDPEEIRSVWADAICINQRDDQEKTHQVRMMRQIFKKAQRALIWLDEYNAHVAQVAFELAGRVYRGQLQSVPPPQSPIWGVFIRLFDKGWFRRIWCLQEVVLASSALVIWGTATAPWEHIGFAAGWLCNIGYEVLSVWITKLRHAGVELQYHPGVYRASLMYSLWLVINGDSSLAKPVSFYDLLCQTRLFEATDSRDKVFALVGIPTADADPEQSRFFIEPDYSKTTDEVFMDVAKRILAGNPASLHLLGAVQYDSVNLIIPEVDQHHPYGGKPTETLPSWVPNWTLFRSRSLVPRARDQRGPLPASRRVTTDGSALLVSGVRFDAVTYVEDLGSREDMSGLCSSLARAWRKINEVFDIDPGRGDLGEAFCWTITAGNNWLGQRVADADRARQIADYEAFRKQHCAEYRFPALEIPQETTLPVKPDARRYYEALCHACSNRGIFVTEKGYIGLGPGSIHQGSEIFLLSGAELPMILKKHQPKPPVSNMRGWTMKDAHGNPLPSEEIMTIINNIGLPPGYADNEIPDGPDPGFSVVGESYVYGIMDGQIESRDSDCKLEDIRLV